MSISSADAATLLWNLESAKEVASTGPRSYLMLQPNPGGIQGVKREWEDKPRKILSKNLTPEAGDLVGMSVAPKLSHDLTRDLADALAASWYRCVAKHAGNKGNSRYVITAVTSTGFTVPALGDLSAGTIINVRGCANPANNGPKIVAASSTGTETKVAGLVAEVTAPNNAFFDVGGVQGADSDFELDSNGDWISTSKDLTTLGLQGGQLLKLGDQDTTDCSFAVATLNGYAEVDPTRAITATKVPLRRHSFAPAANDGADKTIRVMFTRFYRNYPLTNASFSKATGRMELETPSIAAADASAFRTVNGLRTTQVEIDAPLKDAVTVTTSFIGLSASAPYVQAARPSDTATALEPICVGMFNTSGGVKYERLGVASSGADLGMEISGWKLTINLNVKPLEAHGKVGAKDHIDGDMEPMVSFDGYLTTDEIAKAAADNRDVFFMSILGNEDGGCAFYIPATKVRKDAETYAAGDAVKLTLESPGHRERASGIVASLSVFGYLPN